MCGTLTTYKWMIFLRRADDLIQGTRKRVKCLWTFPGVISGAVLCQLLAFPVCAVAQTVIIDTAQFSAGSGYVISQARDYSLQSSAVADVNSTTLQFGSSRESAGVLITADGASLTNKGLVSGNIGVHMTGNATLLNDPGETYISLSVENSPGADDFSSAPDFYMRPFQASQTATEYYNYQAFAYQGPANGDVSPVLPNDAANFFFVDATDGRAFFGVFGRFGSPNNGSAAAMTTITGSDTSLLVNDDAIPGQTPENILIEPGVLSSIMGWNVGLTDGFALGGVTDQSDVTTYLYQRVGDTPRTNVNKINLFGANGQVITLDTITDHQRLRFVSAKGGLIEGIEAGVYLDGGSGVIVNSGTIAARGDAIRIEQTTAGMTTTVINEQGAEIRGDSDKDALGRAINAQGSTAAGLAGTEIVENAGKIVGDVFLGAGNDVLRNWGSGTITGLVDGGSGMDRLLIETAAGQVWLADTADFTGFETVELNATAGSTGTIRLQGPNAFAGDGGALSSVTLHRGSLAGHGGIAGSLAVLTDGVVSPGNSIGTISVAGNYMQNGVYRAEYRAPAVVTNLIASPQGGQALAGLNTVFALGGSPLAASLADQDADLVSVIGTAALAADARLVLVPVGAQGDFEAALQAEGNSALEIRYLILRSEGGGTGRLAGVALGDVAIEYQNDAGEVIATNLTATDTTTGWTNAVLVVGGRGEVTGGGVLPDMPPVGEDGQLADFSVGREQLPVQVTSTCDTGPLAAAKDGLCLWLGTERSRGRADISRTLSEDLSESRLDLGIETRFGDAAGLGAGRAGVFVGTGNTTLTYNTGADADIDTTRFGLYGMIEDEDSEMAANLVMGRHKVVTQRPSLLSRGSIEGAYSARSMSLAAGYTRWVRRSAAADIGWLSGVSYTRGERDAYTETGSATEAFRLDAASTDAVWLILGMRARSGDGASPFSPAGNRFVFDGFAGLDVLLAGDPALDVSGNYIADAKRTVLTGPGGARYGDAALLVDIGVTKALGKLANVSFGLSGRMTQDSDAWGIRAALEMQW